MFRHLAGNLVLHERIETTEAKAKELRRIAERLLSRALRLGDDLQVDVGKLGEDQRQAVLARRMHAQRVVASFLPRRLCRTLPDGSIEEVDLVHKLFHELAPRYLPRVQAGRGGGYTRILKKGLRRGDRAPMTFIEFISPELKEREKIAAPEASKSTSGVEMPASQVAPEATAPSAPEGVSAEA